MGGNVLEGADHVHVFTEEVLGALTGAALFWHLHRADLGRHQGNRDVDQDLALEVILDRIEGGDLMRGRHRQHDNVPGFGCSTVLHRFGRCVRAECLQRGDGFISLLLGARTNNDFVTGFRPANCQASTKVSSAAQNSDGFFC